MATSPNRKRLEVPVEVYDMLEREARWLHIPVANLATLLLREQLEARAVDRKIRAERSHELVTAAN